MTSISHMDVKFLWGNSNYDYVCSESLGNSGGILCIWEASIFKKINTTVSDNFIAIYGTWLPTNSKILFIAIYAPQQTSCKRKLWDYISNIVGRWNGESIIMGDFNEVRSSEEPICLDRTPIGYMRPIPASGSTEKDCRPTPFRFYHSGSLNIVRGGHHYWSVLCPVCSSREEALIDIFFRCDLASACSSSYADGGAYDSS
ncbi:RNA-directed DNA polymerase, eukaryota [Tanacetum coccineum]